MCDTRRTIIICDVDDTVAPSTQCASKEMFDQIDSMTGPNKIFTFVFISGSTVDQILGQLLYGPTATFHVLGTSGNKYDLIVNGWRTHVYEKKLHWEDVDDIIDEMQKLTLKYDLPSMTTIEDQIQNRGSQVTLSCLGRHAPQDAKRKFDPDKKRRTKWARELELTLNSDNNPRYQVTVGGTTSIDVTMLGDNKAQGIEKWLKRNPWANKEDIVFIGDNLQEGGNDFPVTKLIKDCIPTTDPEQTLQILREIRTYGLEPHEIEAESIR